jgi:hypothetical protein
MSEGFVHPDPKGEAKECPLSITLQSLKESGCPFGGEANYSPSLKVFHRLQLNNCGNSTMNSQNRSAPRKEGTSPRNKQVRVRCLT